MDITLEQAKSYLRVDSEDEDELIGILLSSAKRLCADVARLPQEHTPTEPAEAETLRIAVLYALAYLYEHREEADHHELTLTLRSLLFAVREGVF